METPLLHRQKKVGRSAEQFSCKLIASFVFSSVLVLLVVTSKQDAPAELVQWVVPKAAQGKSVPINPKMEYLYVQSGDLHHDDRNIQQVLELSGSSSSKLSAVCKVLCYMRGQLW